MEGVWAALGENPSATLILAIAVLSVMFGLLVPKWVAQTWRRAWEMSERARQEQDKQLSRIIASQELQVRLLEAIRDAAKEKSP